MRWCPTCKKDMDLTLPDCPICGDILWEKDIPAPEESTTKAKGKSKPRSNP